MKYNVDQQKFEGEYKEYQVSFKHPFIEIDKGLTVGGVVGENGSNRTSII